MSPFKDRAIEQRTSLGCRFDLSHPIEPKEEYFTKKEALSLCLMLLSFLTTKSALHMMLDVSQDLPDITGLVARANREMLAPHDDGRSIFSRSSSDRKHFHCEINDLVVRD